MMGVCFGLLMALCLLVASITCTTRRRRLLKKPPPSPERRQLKESSEEDEEATEDDEEEDEEGGEEEDVPKVTVYDGGSQSDGTLRSLNVFASAEELEKARRLEERERIVREIWRNGQPDILATGTGTIGRVHYHWGRLTATVKKRGKKRPQHLADSNREVSELWMHKIFHAGVKF